MAIQPIDLSTVYSQMDKMGQMNASQIQSAHMANRAHLEKSAQQDSEKARTVQETHKNKDSNSIKADVNQGGGAGQGLLADDGTTGKKAVQEEVPVEKPKPYEIRDPNLGRHIDITG
ncbi:MAG: hypothetical protein MST12_02045 [Spirochaetia bacterium]|uniref:hypothetical protein n=1 Tax=Treponema sp. TaxID=166 RepID=UPI00298DC6BD|nr:hypothetical protein [Treponema sp.]MCI7577018.1 hypothetical protein [Spirochaetia bacterium]